MKETIKNLYVTETPDHKVILTVDRQDFNPLLRLLTREGLNIFISRIRNNSSTAVELNCSPDTYWATLNSMSLVKSESAVS